MAAGASLVLPACGPDSADRTKPQSGPLGAIRIDVRHNIANATASFDLVRLRAETHAPRAFSNPAQRLDWGDYRLSLYDAADGTLLFRDGFDSSLDPAARAASTELSVRVPMPKRTARAVIERRRVEAVFQEVWRVAIDPADDAIDRSPATLSTRADAIVSNGPPQSKVDLAIVGDGYTNAEYPKFLADVKRAADALFSVEPFAKRAREFNLRSVFTPSAESGITDPYLSVRKNTALRCAYDGGERERTLAVHDHYALREVASAVPYDFLLVLANSRRYGGSAYFGGPAVVSIDSAASRYLVLHELAHVIGGLAEEYYIPAGDGPAYLGNVEPWHPNVTISAAKAKWPAASGVVAWNKTEYDKYFSDYVKRYMALRDARAEETSVESFMRRAREQQAMLLGKNRNRGQVGFFEGANGYAKGVFRSEVDCIMFSLQTDHFCYACATAIERMIDEHCL